MDELTPTAIAQRLLALGWDFFTTWSHEFITVHITRPGGTSRDHYMLCVDASIPSVGYVVTLFEQLVMAVAADHGEEIQA